MWDMWKRLGGPARAGLVAGTVGILALVAALAWWAYRPDYQVLFADLAPRDAAAMAAELDRLKTPYQLADNGNTILVPRAAVYRTRLKLMASDVPLHGAVGFEVFNNADFGMTDFVQKVNYQRAIQGELTRTILALEDIQSARVHLALPEQGLFKKTAARPKASVTLAVRPGRTLAPDQVAGIQRLVAASVPDIVAADVTVLDQHGVALTRAAAEAGEAAAGAPLDAKRAAEEYLGRKVAQVLDRTFGPGEALASVDVVLNMDQARVTTDEILPARMASAEGAPAGVVVRERHTVREAEGGGAKAQAGADTSSEAEYQVGRRTEQVAVAPGALKRMTIAVVVRQPLSDAQRERLRDVVANAAGLSPARGDTIVVSSVDSLVSGVRQRDGAVASAAADPALPAAAVPARPNTALVPWVLAALALAAGAGGVLYVRRRRPPRALPPLLGEAERAQLAADVRQWIQAVPAGPGQEAP